MSWKQLLAQHKVHLHRTSNEELGQLRALIDRDLNDAALSGLSADRRFATAYNAALQTAKMAIACAGYRVASTPGHHRLHFEAARIALGSSADRAGGTCRVRHSPLRTALKKACPGDGCNGRVVHPALQRLTCVSLPVHRPCLPDFEPVI